MTPEVLWKCLFPRVFLTTELEWGRTKVFQSRWHEAGRYQNSVARELRATRG